MDTEEGTFSSRCYIIKILTGGIMKEYTAKQMKELEKNPYVYKATKHMIYYSVKFKEDFWTSYQAGNTPRKILADFGFDLSMFGQKQIDSLVQHIKKQALSGNGFSEGCNRTKRVAMKATDEIELSSPQSIERMQNELLYLRQEVEFLKKLLQWRIQRRKSNHGSIKE